MSFRQRDFNQCVRNQVRQQIFDKPGNDSCWIPWISFLVTSEELQPCENEDIAYAMDSYVYAIIDEIVKSVSFNQITLFKFPLHYL